jgi:phosphatidate cytidylyltransferase
MALNLATFRKRTLTAAIFVLVMLAGLLWSPWSFFLLFSVIHFGCWFEYHRLLSAITPAYANRSPFQRTGVAVAGWCVMLYLTDDSMRIWGISLHALGWWLGLVALFVLPVIELLFTRQLQVRNLLYVVLGLLYISLSWGLLLDLYRQTTLHYHTALALPRGAIVYLVIGSIWINDTMAYLTGSLIGKTPLSKVSPKKTWEGTLGGIFLSSALTALLFYLIDAWNPFMFPATMITFIAAVSGTAGDLLESKLKRMAGVKDSGHFMPGHGGFLDRFDSLLLATPVVWLCYYLAFR